MAAKSETWQKTYARGMLSSQQVAFEMEVVT